MAEKSFRISKGFPLLGRAAKTDYGTFTTDGKKERSKFSSNKKSLILK